jgi:hypothetical protein
MYVSNTVFLSFVLALFLSASFLAFLAFLAFTY